MSQAIVLNGRMMKVSTPPRDIAETLKTLRHRFGDGAVVTLGETKQREVAAIPTGIPALDKALGVGGLPRGRIVDVFGPESGGKTTFCLKVIAEAQRLGGIGVFVDTEHALDMSYARYCGVAVDNLYISQPDTAEEALEIVEALVRVGVAVVVVDSAAGLVPRAEVEAEMGDNHLGLMARLMSQALRKLAGPVRKNNTTLIFTNQLRIRSEVMFGNPETSTGGMALRHYASVRLDLRRIQAVKSEGQVVGVRIRATVKKNKVAPPFRSAEFDLWYS